MNEFMMRAFRKMAESFEELTTPKRRRSRVHFRPSLEGLEERRCPATVNMYWDFAGVNKNASNAANWDVGSLGSGTHPAAAPGNTAGETDNIAFDGTAGKNGNQNCTWDYTPTQTLGYASFQNSYTQTVTFSDKQGFSVSNYAIVSPNSAPTLTPNGTSGASAVAAITLTKGTAFTVNTGGTLFLQGYSSGNAVFLAGDGTAGDYLANGGTVAYSGVGSNASTANIDYLKVPVANGGGVFKVNGNKGTTTYGSKLQVSGADTKNTSGVSFYQQGGSNAETDISGNGTLWCVNDFKMTAGKLQTTDDQTDNLQVGTSGSSPVDGTVTLTGGTVNINPGANVYGMLQILGTTTANVPTLNVGTVMLNFKVNMTADSTQCDQLIVGKSSGKANFGNNGGTTSVAINAQGTVTPRHKWQVILFGIKTGDVTLMQTGYTKTWKATYLEIDN